MKIQMLGRRKFVAVLATASAGALVVPVCFKSRAQVYNGIQVYQEEGWSSQYPNNSAPVYPEGLPVQPATIDAIPLGGIGTVYPAGPGNVPYQVQAAFDAFAANNPPSGFTPAVPQLALLEILIGGALLVAGAYAAYKIWKWADTLIPPPDTNIYH